MRIQNKPSKPVPSPTGTSPKGAGRNEGAVPSVERDVPQAHRVLAPARSGGGCNAAEVAPDTLGGGVDFKLYLAGSIVMNLVILIIWLC